MPSRPKGHLTLDELALKAVQVARRDGYLQHEAAIERIGGQLAALGTFRAPPAHVLVAMADQLDALSHAGCEEARGLEPTLAARLERQAGSWFRAAAALRAIARGVDQPFQGGENATPGSGATGATPG